MRKFFTLACLIVAGMTGAAQAATAPYQLLIGNRIGGVPTDRILSYGGGTGVPSPTNPYDATNSAVLNAPQQFLHRPDGTVLVVSQDTNSVKRYDEITGAFISTFASVAGNGGSNPVGLAVDPTGNIYVSNFSSQNVLRYNSAGTFIDTFIAPIGASLATSTFGPDGNYYVRDLGSARVRQYSPAGALLNVNFITSVNGSGSLVVGPDDRIYVLSNATVVRRDPLAGVQNVFTLTGGPALTDMSSFAFGFDHNLYLLDNDADRVLRYQGPFGATPGAYIDTFISGGAGGLTRGINMTFVPEPAIGMILAPAGVFALRRRRHRRRQS
jgi:streptogramin lyase